MAPLNLVTKPSVEKDLRRIPAHMVERLLEAAERLRGDPHPAGSLKLSGPERLYRIRVGAYRIVYEVDVAAKTVTLHYIRHRKDVYRGLHS
jgi:mRNA interferase RelE/StbE